MFTREEIEELEFKTFSPFAMKARYTKGRAHLEEEHPYRSSYQRDRDRIIHSTAFRRLEYKTQVFVNHEGDYYRTRLTHTLEVAQIASSIARNLGLNTDLTEAIALAHDIGHPPFGHSGEDELEELMKDYGGFDHNLQGLRVVDILEERYPSFKGLNLTWEVRTGINKHASEYKNSEGIIQLKPEGSPTLEAQVVDLSDEIAYDNHDLDDGLTSGLLNERALREIPLWGRIQDKISEAYPGLKDEIRRFQIIRELINIEVTDLIFESEKRIRDFNIKTPDDAQKISGEIILFSQRLLEERKLLKEFLFENLYMHHKVVRMADKSRRFVRDLFNAYLANPELLPDTSRHRMEQEQPQRVVCDYIAGMTDRYALDEYVKLFNPYERI